MGSPRAHDNQIAIFEDSHDDNDESLVKELDTHHEDEDHEHQSFIHEDPEHDGYTDEEDEEEEEDDDDDQDPFTSSPPHKPEYQHDIILSAAQHQNRPSFVSHNYDQSFSTTTAVHLDGTKDPLLEYDANALANDFAQQIEERDTAYDEQQSPRKVSQSVSTLLDELEYYRPAPRSALSNIDNTPHDETRRFMPTPMRHSLHTPNSADRQRNATTIHNTNMPTHSRSNSAIHSHQRTQSAGRPVFRNPSSVRAMQLSSPTPPPYASSPLGQRQISQSPFPVSSEPRPRRPSHHPDPRKEYPLVLLHCTLSVIPLPAACPSQALDAAGASDGTKSDVALLQQRLSATVLERGLLVPHPGDDYELLRERVLENLELERPRVGGCGHFKAPEDMDNDPEKCDDCARPLDTALLPAPTRDAIRRWDVRVYAANGLMRAGAWAAAWREMEKVDVEVGVWVPDDVRSRLEAWAAQHEASEPPQVQQTAPVMIRERSLGGTNAGDASTAAVSRPGSSRRNRAAPDFGTQERRPEALSMPEQAPLSTLLAAFLLRTFARYRDVVLTVLALLLAAWIAARGFGAPQQASVDGKIVASTSDAMLETAEAPSMPAVEPVTVTVTESAAATPSVTVSAINDDDAVVQSVLQRLSLTACAFEDGAPGPGMTAVPSADARAVLEGLVEKEIGHGKAVDRDVGAESLLGEPVLEVVGDAGQEIAAEGA